MGSREEGALNVNRSAPHYRNPETDGWMTCSFMSFSTVFQSYQDDGQMIMKGCVQRNPVYDWNEQGSNSGQKDQ